MSNEIAKVSSALAAPFKRSFEVPFKAPFKVPYEELSKISEILFETSSKTTFNDYLNHHSKYHLNELQIDSHINFHV